MIGPKNVKIGNDFHYLLVYPAQANPRTSGVVFARDDTDDIALARNTLRAAGMTPWTQYLTEHVSAPFAGPGGAR